MTIEHKNIDDANLHEPLGVASAAVGTVYVADGAGSGAWSPPPHNVILHSSLADVSSPSSTYFVAPVAGTIESISTVLHGAITAANSLITFFINGIPITNSTVTVAFSGSAAGSRFFSTPTALNTIAAGDLITATSDGGSSTGNIQLSIALKVKVS